MEICLEWMKQNLSDNLMKCPKFLNEIAMRMFFYTLLQLAHSEEKRLQMLEMIEVSYQTRFIMIERNEYSAHTVITS